MKEYDRPVNHETTATISFVIIAIGLVVYFAILPMVPPEYVQAGPFVLGARTGTCHGMTDKSTNHPYIEVCK